MTPDEQAIWIAFYNVEPFGDRQADLRAGIISNAILSPWSKDAPSPAELFPSLQTSDTGRGWLTDPQMMKAGFRLAFRSRKPNAPKHA